MLCVISEPSDDGKEVITSVLDPLKGRGRELNRFALGSGDKSWAISLSPDGSRFAVTRGNDALIRILSLEGRPIQQIKVKGVNKWDSPTWAADRKGFYLSVDALRGKSILHVDLHGNARTVWNIQGATGGAGIPSPDGRHLLITTWTKNDNLWMIENF